MPLLLQSFPHVCLCVCACVFWVGGGEFLICGAVRRREVVFQTRYGGSAVERKTFLTLGTLTCWDVDQRGYLQGRDWFFFPLCVSVAFFSVSFVSFDTLSACEWKMLNRLTKMDKYPWYPLSRAAVSGEVSRFLTSLWNKPALNAQGALLWPQNAGPPCLQTELN